MMLLVTFRDTVTLGSVILGILIGLLGLAVLFYGARWKSAYMVAEANAEAWKETATRLELKLQELEITVTSLRARVAELEALPDVAAVHAFLVTHDQATARMMETHDDNAELRAQRLISAIRELPQGG